MPIMYKDFSGLYGDFETMFQDTTLSSYNVFTWRDSPNVTAPVAMRIIGLTPLKQDYLLHTVYVPENRWSTETEELIDEFGISFISLSQLLGDWGITVHPIPEGESKTT